MRTITVTSPEIGDRAIEEIDMNEVEAAYNEFHDRPGRQINSRYDFFEAGWNARHKLTCVHEWELGDCTKMHDRFFWFCTKCKAVEETNDVNPPQMSVLASLQKLDAKLAQIANGHKCIACGMEHPACCGSCRTHCYKCGQPRLTHDEDRCHAKWVGREPPTTEAEELAEHVRANNITSHSINADGSCNMGCC